MELDCHIKLHVLRAKFDRPVYMKCFLKAGNAIFLIGYSTLADIGLAFLMLVPQL